MGDARNQVRERIVYSDNHLLAVNKPAGLLTQESGSGRDNLEDQARAWVREEKSKPGAVFLHALHRLDQPVSGIVLFARTSKALRRLQEVLRQRDQVRKIYHAWVAPAPVQPAAELVDYLIKKDQRAMRVDSSESRGKKAVLTYRLLARKAAGALLEIELQTGRYHQIRAQLAAIGSPIIGDGKYGSSHSDRIIQLHHRRFEIPHPTQPKRVVIEAPAAWE